MFGYEKEKTKEDIEKSVLEKVALQSVVEQRRKRRWGIFFKLIFLAYLIFILLLAMKPFSMVSKTTKPYLAMVKIDNIISDDTISNARLVNKGLTEAFRDAEAKAIVVSINSPGGSPVQSDDIYEQIRYLQNKYPDKKVYAICEDVCASGAYYIASAVNTIYANKMSLVGSIGVRAGGFGFVEAMKKLGITRRLYTAGKNKAFLDPFQSEEKNQVKDLEKILDQTHTVFIDSVKKGRGDKLDMAKAETIFSGLPFSGIEAKKLGLIDGFKSIDEIKRTLKTENIIDYTRKQDIVDRVLGRMGLTMFYDAYKAATLKLQ